MLVKTVFLCDVSIRPNLCLKLLKVDKVTARAIRRGYGDLPRLLQHLQIIYDGWRHRT